MRDENDETTEAKMKATKRSKRSGKATMTRRRRMKCSRGSWFALRLKPLHHVKVASHRKGEYRQTTAATHRSFHALASFGTRKTAAPPHPGDLTDCCLAPHRRQAPRHIGLTGCQPLGKVLLVKATHAKKQNQTPARRKESNPNARKKATQKARTKETLEKNKILFVMGKEGNAEM